MIAYLDASALVKRYIVERGSRETIALTAARLRRSEATPRTFLKARVPGLKKA